MDRGALWATVHGIAKSRTRLGIAERHGLEMRRVEDRAREYVNSNSYTSEYK